LKFGHLKLSGAETGLARAFGFRRLINIELPNAWSRMMYPDIVLAVKFQTLSG
jgi:hypothetical protein